MKSIKSRKNLMTLKIEEKSHIKTSKTDKSQSAIKKESKKYRINTSSVFQWNTSSLHAAKDSRMAHENKLQEKEKLRKLLTAPMHQK